MATTQTLIKTATDEEYDKLFKHVRQGEDMLERKHRQLGGKSKSELQEYLAALRKAWKERKQSGGNHTTEIPDEIRDILTSVADYYSVEAEAIYKKYLDLKEKLDQPYPLDKFKRTLEGAKDSLAFETGGFIRPLKLDYTDKLTHNRITVYRLTADNSKDDIIKEAHKAEAVCYELGDKHILTKRAKSTGEARLDKVMSKEKLIEYLWQLFDLVDESLVIQESNEGGENNG